MALSAFQTALEGKRLLAKARLYSYFEPALGDEAELLTYVEELLGHKVDWGEFALIAEWLQKELKGGLAASKRDAARVTRVDSPLRTVRARRFLATAEPVMPGPAAANLHMLDAGPHVQKRWRTSREAKRAEHHTEDARATVEREVRVKWLEEGVTILRQIGAPILHDASGAERSDEDLVHAFGRRRTSTLRTRICVWKRWFSWALARKGSYAKVMPAECSAVREGSRRQRVRTHSTRISVGQLALH